MLLIAHRGNLNGPDPEHENTNEALWKAWGKGFHVEADVWCVENTLYLGHDKPHQPLDTSLLAEACMWWHAKNPEALAKLLEWNAHCFFHEADTIVLTSRRFLWVHQDSRNFRHPKAVLVIPNPEYRVYNVHGVCTDYPIKYRGLCE
jgi:hypothetical protein